MKIPVHIIRERQRRNEEEMRRREEDSRRLPLMPPQPMEPDEGHDMEEEKSLMKVIVIQL